VVERAPHGLAAHGDVMMTSQIICKLGFGRVRRLLDQQAHVLQSFFVEEGRNPTPMRSGLQTPGRPRECEIVAHRAYGHHEPFGDFS
jgi:hypothetical protein